MKKFHYRTKVRFADTDPAGIVFYPRYFEMVNETIEEWYANLGFPFEAMHIVRKYAVPLVHIEADFKKPSRLGEELDFYLTVNRVGRTSVEVEITVDCNGEHRFKTVGVMVFVEMDKGRPAPWPDEIGKILETWPAREKGKA